MKKLNSCLLCLMILVISMCTSKVSDKEIPISTTSKKALKLFIAAREKAENLDQAAAVKLYDQALEADPDFALALLGRANIPIKTVNKDAHLEKAYSLADKITDGERNFILYIKDLASGNKGKSYLDKLIADFPSDKRVQFYYGLYYYNNQEFQKALQYFEKATQLDQFYAPAYNILGYSYLKLKRYEEAEKAFIKYIELEPELGNPYDSYAEFLLTLERYDESIKQYQLALEKDPVNMAGSYRGVGDNHVFLEEYESAREYYQKYFDNTPNNFLKLDAIDRKAISYILEGNTSQAFSELESYQIFAEKNDLKPYIARSYTTRASLLLADKKIAEARLFAEKSLEAMNNENFPEPARKVMMPALKLLFAECSAFNGESDNAIAEIERCMAEGADEKMCNTAMIQIQYLKGNFDKALEYSSKVTIPGPKTWYFTGLSYLEKGDVVNAEKQFKNITDSKELGFNMALYKGLSMTSLAKLNR